MIIFDLDDTLIDTFGSIIPGVVKRVIFKLFAHGLKIKDISLAFERIMEINRTAASTKESFKIFLKEIGGQDYLEIAECALDEKLPGTLKVRPLKNAKKILKRLSSKAILAMVTRGKRDNQLLKLRSAHIDFSLFSSIAICEGEKGPYYKKIVEFHGMLPHEVWVCGDRPAIDLVPAKDLGYNTIHVRNGRELSLSDKGRGVDFSVSQLEEIETIIFPLKGKR